jgi:hypothetical protein
MICKSASKHGQSPFICWRCAEDSGCTTLENPTHIVKTPNTIRSPSSQFIDNPEDEVQTTPNAEDDKYNVDWTMDSSYHVVRLREDVAEALAIAKDIVTNHILYLRTCLLSLFVTY